MNRIQIGFTFFLLFLFFSAPPASGQNVIAWGDNDSGQTDIPASVTNVIQVAAGWHHSLALRDDGTVISWGAITNVPAEATNIVAVAAGALHNIVLRADGRIWVWGDNRYRQSDLSGMQNVAAIAAGEFHNIVLYSNKTARAWGLNTFSFPLGITNVAAVTSGAKHVLLALEDGSTIPCFFGNESWMGNTLRRPLLSMTNVVRYFGGSTNNLALNADGTVKPWGLDKQPQPPLSTSNIVTVAPSTNCVLALRMDGTVVAWGDGAVTNVPASATNVIAIAAGRSHGLAVVGDGNPRLFQSSPIYRKVTSHGNSLPLTALAAGSDLEFQWFADGEPITGATNFYPQIPAKLELDDAAFYFVASNSFGSVTSEVASVRVLGVAVWGDNANKQRNVPVTVSNAVAIAAGGFHGLALNENGSVIVWGKTNAGRCTVPRAATNIISIAAGVDHSLAVRNDGLVFAWGGNWDGQTNVPASVSDAVSVAGGWAHSLALQANGNVIAWGNNDYNQTNVPPYARDITAIAAGYYHNLALKWDGSVIAWGNGEEGFVPSSATNVVAISAGWEHSLALRADGSIVAWGDNSYRQCDVPESATNIIAIAAAYYHSLALRADGTVVAWGKGHFGVTNISPELGHVSAIAAGEDFSMALVRVGTPVFAPASASVAAHAGGRVVLTTGIGGTHPLTLQWHFEGMPISGATNHFLVLEGLQPADAGVYTLEVTNASGESSSYVVDLTVDSAPYIVSAPRRDQVPPFNILSLSVETLSLEPLTFQWRHDGTNLIETERIQGVNQSSLHLNTAEFEDSGIYEVVVSNSAGSQTGMISQVVVTPIVGWGKNLSGQTEAPPEATNIAAIAAGNFHSIALTTEGSVLAWGDNSFGQTTVPPEATNVIMISAGETHNLALKDDGTVIAWGDNRYGACNVPTAATNLIAVEAGRYHSFGIRSNGTLATWPNISIPASFTNIIAVDSSDWTVLGLRADGTAAAKNMSLPLDWTNLIAVAVGRGIDLVLREDGTVLNRFYYQPSFAIPQTNAIAVAAGDYHGLTLDADGVVRGWGSDYSMWAGNHYGQIEVPDYARNAIAISAGADHSLALVEVNSNLHFTDAPSNQVVSSGHEVNLNASVRGRGPISYQWFFKGTEIGDATNVNHAFISDVSLSGDYKIVASNPWSSVTSSVAVVTVVPPPTITTQPQSQSVAVGSTALFNVEAIGPALYQWRFESSDLPGATTSALQLLSVTPESSGNYDVVVSNIGGSITSAPARLNVIIPSVLNLNISGGTPFLSFEANNEVSYTIQFTTNLASGWHDLITLSNSSEVYQFTHTNFMTNGSGFYRAVGN